MKNKILVIFLFLILFLGTGFCGVYLGLFLQAKKDAPQLEAADKLQNLGKSKITQAFNILAEGEISKISGRTITLKNEDETIDIPIQESDTIMTYTSVQSQEQGSQATYSRKDLTFEDLKAGDKANVNIRVAKDGQFQSVIVFLVSQTQVK